MTRSRWKGPSIQQKFKQKKTIIIPRYIEILPRFVGFDFNIHNGKNYTNLTVKETMINHKFGEFSFTRFKK